MKKDKKIKKMAMMASLTALTVVLQLIANYIVIGTVSINLALIPLVVAAILYGPLGGGFIGLVIGALILTAPSTGFFLGHNALATVFLCLLKTSLAGVVAGGLFRILKKFRLDVAVILSALIVPIVNTALFFVGCLIWFLPLYGGTANEAVGAILSFDHLNQFPDRIPDDRDSLTDARVPDPRAGQAFLSGNRRRITLHHSDKMTKIGSKSEPIYFSGKSDISLRGSASDRKERTDR